MKVCVNEEAVVRWGQPLPPHYLPDDNERCIELPLAFELIRPYPLVLDAGCAMNHPNSHVYMRGRFIHATLSGETAYVEQDADGRIKPHQRRLYVSADIRALPFRAASMPAVACISTLEHIGGDNSHYRGAKECAFETAWRAVAELRRVASDLIVISVPFGRGEIHPSGRWRAWGAHDLSRLLALLQPATTQVAYYSNTGDGWTVAGPEIAERRAWRGEKRIQGLIVVRALVPEEAA